MNKYERGDKVNFRDEFDRKKKGVINCIIHTEKGGDFYSIIEDEQYPHCIIYDDIIGIAHE